MNKKLNKKLKTFNITELKPQGWLKNQLEIQMNGLTGILYKAWDSVGSYSGWLGGTGENWERAPYYLDGLIPLSYYLDDKEHWEICCRFVEWTLGSQDEAGNFGPDASKLDYWSRYAMMKALIQFAEITGDKRVAPFCMKYLLFVEKAIAERPVKQWSKARVGDLIYCAAWVHEQAPNDELYRIVESLRKQALDWDDIFSAFPFTRPAGYYYNWDKVHENNDGQQYDSVMAYHATHIVNVTMGLKYPAMLHCFDNDATHYNNCKVGIDVLRQYHGVASGAVNGDEHLSGNDPSQGSELCSVVEYMFSLQCMMEVFGDTSFADELERLTYNALPATITEDFMAHQYLQQANQVLVDNSKRNWFNNDNTANMFGLEPNFGCCTANMHQGWPKYLKSLWYRGDNNCILSMAFAPSSLATEINEKPFNIELQTEYPFKDTLNYSITKADNVNATIKIRIPAWCESAKLTCEIKQVTTQVKDGFMELTGVWNSGDNFQVVLPMETKFTSWYRDSVAVERGPLVFGLDMQESWRVTREVAGIKDYAVSSSSAWNYAIDKDSKPVVKQLDVHDTPFSKEHAPVVISLKGRKLNNWQIQDNSAAPVPQSPVATTEPDEDLRLIPFGCTKLRISQFPYWVK